MADNKEKMMKLRIPLYIFDLDGTLALTEHRQHILDNKDNPHRWDAFFEACVNDLPNEPVINTMRALAAGRADILIWSGRSTAVRPQTVEWLARHTHMMTHDIEEALLMRDVNDYTPDDELKEMWLSVMRPSCRERLVGVFDDRDKVVAMWRRNNVACFQVAPGAF